MLGARDTYMKSGPQMPPVLMESIDPRGRQRPIYKLKLVKECCEESEKVMSRTSGNSRWRAAASGAVTIRNS